MTKYKVKIKPGDLAWPKVADILGSTTMLSREKYFTDMVGTMDVDTFLSSALKALVGIPETGE